MKHDQLKEKAAALYAKLGGMGSRDARIVRALSEEIDRYREWIAMEGNQTDTCTFNVLREVCDGCRCHRMPNPPDAAILCRLERAATAAGTIGARKGDA